MGEQAAGGRSQRVPEAIPGPDLDQPARPFAGALYLPLALLFSLLWASAFVAVKVGLRSSPPLFLMGFRFLLAGVALLLFARLRGRPLPASRRDWGRLAILGLLNNAVYLGLSAVALRHLSAGMGAILASTNPLLLAAAAPALLGERLGARKALGLALAFGSVVAIMSSRTARGDSPGAMALLLLANAVMVAGTILFKRWAPRGDLPTINGVQLLTASAALLVPSLLGEPVAAVRWDVSFLLVLAYLGGAVSCGAMLIWFFLLRSGDAGKASAFFFLNPVFGLFLGALLLDERVRALDLLGTAGVATGIWLVQRAR